MSQRETTDVIGHLEVGQSPKDNLPKLVELARQAHEQKRTKDCLDLTRAILLIDPENAAANWMRSSLQTEMHRDLESARAFLRQARSKENPEPESGSSQTEISAEKPEESLQEIIQAVAGAAAPAPKRTRERWVALGMLVVVLGVGLAVAALPRFRAAPKPVQAAVSKPIQEAKAPDPVPLPPPEHSPLVPITAVATQTPVPASAPAPAFVGERPSAKLPEPRVVAAAGGTLAVSSPTSVDIFENDTYIGSAPVSLELSGGAHTLEYRHGNLRKRVTHVINGNETSRAMITFDVSVQINSKPWAEVSLDGVEKKPLGQTPLSGVRVPIGSVLVFENPQFQTKKYRVTGNETGIQIVFP